MKFVIGHKYNIKEMKLWKLMNVSDIVKKKLKLYTPVKTLLSLNTQ